MKKKELRNVPFKNYVKAVILFIVVIVVTLYARKLYLVNVENNLNQSPLSRIVGEIKITEYDSVFLEVDGDYYMYVSYLNDKSIHELESKMKSVILNNNIENDFYYLNVTDILESDYIKEVNDDLGLKNKVTKLPTLIYYVDGKYKDVLNSSEESPFTLTEFKDFVKRNKLNEKDL